METLGPYAQSCWTLPKQVCFLILVYILKIKKINSGGRISIMKNTMGYFDLVHFFTNFLLTKSNGFPIFFSLLTYFCYTKSRLIMFFHGKFLEDNDFRIEFELYHISYLDKKI